MESRVSFDKDQFNRIFPFYILINSNFVVESVGKTLEKLYSKIAGRTFSDHFRIVRPEISDQSFHDLKSLINQMVVIECKNAQGTTLRGQIEWMEDTNSLIFLGSPWFGSMEQVISNKLSLHDFAYHDPMIDLLHVLKTQEITTEDLKHLLKTVSRQKNDLKSAAKEIQDIALFTTQNPDPLIRIDLEGKILRQNPSAEKITHFEYEDRSYTSEAFWKLISKKLDIQKDRIIIEAISEDETYSFFIKPLPDNGYYNIYGRKVTEQKKNEVQLQILSSIAAQNTHGVVIANRDGKIEWANVGFAKMTGFLRNEILGQKQENFLYGPESDPKTISYLSKQIAKGEPYHCEILKYTKDQKPKWLRIHGQALRDKNGNISNYFSIQEDVTKEKENQKLIREFEDRFRMALEKIGDYVWEHNFKTGLTQFSKKENHFIGVSLEEIKNNKKLWFSSVLEEDRDLLIENDKKYKSGAINDHTLEYRLRHKDGSIKWVLDRGVVIEKDDFGKPLLVIGTHTDITRQKKLELELGATANRLTSLIQNLYAGVLLENEDHTIGLINQQFCDLFHITVNPEALIGTDCSQSAENTKQLFRNPEDFVDRISEILIGQKLVVKEHLEMIDGRHLQRDFIPIWNEGEYSGHLWLYSDITEQMNADTKLTEQRIFYEQILNNMPADIAVFDEQHRYLFLNPQAISNNKFRSWMIGKKDEDYVAYKNLPQRIVEKRRKVFSVALETKKLHSFEEELVQSDGSKKYILRNLYPVLNEKDEVKLVVGYGMDITPIKKIQHQIEESEKRYRDVIDNSLALITTHDLDGNFISVNPMVGKIYGFSDKEMIGNYIGDFLPESDKELFFTKYLKNIKTEKQDSGIFRVRNKNGKIIYTLYNNFLKEEPGMDPYVIGFAVDITERIEAEKELKIAKKTSEEFAEAKQSFLTNMSHEIRTPMNAIIGMSNQLSKTKLSHKQNMFLNTIHTAADNLLVIINDILDLSKIDAGKLTIEEIAFEPKKVIDHAFQVLKHKAEEKGIKLTNSLLDSKLSEVLIGDPHRLNQVLLNLMSNAIKFTDKGSVDVACNVIKNNDTSQSIRVLVKDTGIGMEEEFVKTLFQKFHQEDASVSRRFGGTGLGMAITQSLLHMMGGTIKVVSKKNEGTVISFDIELKKGNVDQLFVKDAIQINTDSLKGRKILIVDDNDMNRLVASTILQNYHVELMEAEDGQQAIDVVEDNNPDIILMDLQMPVLNGLEATLALRKSGNDIPIIAVTANAIRGESEKWLKAGMNDYISKPYKEVELVQKLIKWLNQHNVSNADTHSPKELRLSEVENNFYDLRHLEEISRGNKVFIHKMINIFCDQMPGTVDTMISAYHSGDLQKMGSLAHKMKPSIDNLDILSIKQEIRMIEKAGKKGITDASTEAIILKIKETIEKVILKMQQEVNN